MKWIPQYAILPRSQFSYHSTLWSNKTFDILDAHTYASYSLRAKNIQDELKLFFLRWRADVNTFPNLDHQTSFGPTYEYEYNTRETYGQSITSWGPNDPQNATWWHRVTEGEHSLIPWKQTKLKFFISNGSRSRISFCKPVAIIAMICPAHNHVTRHSAPSRVKATYALPHAQALVQMRLYATCGVVL